MVIKVNYRKDIGKDRKLKNFINSKWKYLSQKYRIMSLIMI